MEYIALRKCDRVLDRVLEFANVVGPRVALERRYRFARELYAIAACP